MTLWCIYALPTPIFESFFMIIYSNFSLINRNHGFTVRAELFRLVPEILGANLGL
jgi:hypothetical protein